MVLDGECSSIGLDASWPMLNLPPLPGLPFPDLRVLDAPAWRCALCLRPMMAFPMDRKSLSLTLLGNYLTLFVILRYASVCLVCLVCLPNITYFIRHRQKAQSTDIFSSGSLGRKELPRFRFRFRFRSTALAPASSCLPYYIYLIVSSVRCPPSVPSFSVSTNICRCRIVNCPAFLSDPNYLPHQLTRTVQVGDPCDSSIPSFLLTYCDAMLYGGACSDPTWITT